MKIRTKMISLLALLFGVLTLLGIVIQTQVLLPSFTALERDAAQTAMKRIDHALDMALEGLESSAADWGNWADVYRFVQAPDADFVRANITPIAFKQLQINALLIVDRDGNLVLAEAREFDSDVRMPLDLVAAKSLPPDFPWLRHMADGRAARGLIRTNRGVMLIASAPILDGSGRGVSRGMVIMGRLMTPEQLHKFGAQAQTAVTLRSTDPGGRDGARVGDQTTETETAIEVDRTFADVYGEPVLRLRVDMPRDISRHGARAIAYACVYLFCAGVAAMLLLIVIVNRVVLAPLARVTRHAVMIGEGADLTARLDPQGSDEIAMLAHEFDRMVERVAESRQQLVDQSFAAGFAEVAKGVMHNLGNAMTPLGVRVATLADALRAAPVADVELAARELGAATADPARRADLEELLRLGAAELGNALKAARLEVAVIQRQAMIVQTALTELMHATRNEHVVESVRLPELVSQTLEIVPDSCRQRLVVQADESLRRVGVVHVARTVLRLVLQNLIINAADAVRDAGREKGLLRVAAEIVHDAGHRQLHLRCEDDGVGIPQQDLERVFDPGFSTKSRGTNHGIGLHWCANAIAALGGRIWAASEGPGLGACLHLVLPLTINHGRSAA
jgi:sensor domain CHASE-containing protein